MERRPTLSLNEWAVLGVLAGKPRHGYDVAAELRPGTELGQVWSLSRRLVYRAVERLTDLGLVEPRREEPGIAGPRRTVYGVTRRGRSALRGWLEVPVDHVRDLRSELLLKLVLARRMGVDPTPLVHQQQVALAEQLDALRTPPADGDPVALWRHHSAIAAERFLADLSR